MTVVERVRVGAQGDVQSGDGDLAGAGGEQEGRAVVLVAGPQVDTTAGAVSAAIERRIIRP